MNGRKALTWEGKFELDVWYVENRSLWVNLKILCTMLIKILKRSGIISPEHAYFFTSSQSRGNDDTLLRQQYTMLSTRTAGG